MLKRLGLKSFQSTRIDLNKTQRVDQLLKHAKHARLKTLKKSFFRHYFNDQKQCAIHEIVHQGTLSSSALLRQKATVETDT